MTSILKKRGHELKVTRLYLGGELPHLEAVDWLIILGGDMGIHDEAEHPWLKGEKILIRDAVKSGTPVLGICLGAQLIAHALGARVEENPHPEIGWFPVTRKDQVSKTILGDTIPRVFEAFHWHNDTFGIPDGARELGSSRACNNQGFVKGNYIVGLQFHPEVRQKDVQAFFDQVGPGPDEATYVQSKKKILCRQELFDANKRLMASLLDAMEKSIKPQVCRNL